MVSEALNQSVSVAWPADETPYCVAIPLRVSDVAFGVVTFGLDDPAPGFSPSDINAAEELSVLASAAIERSKMRLDTRDAIRRTQRIASQLHQLIATSIAVAGFQSEKDVLRRFAQSARNVYNADRVLLSLERGPLAPLLGIAERDRPATCIPLDEDALPTELRESRARDLELWSDNRWCVAPLLVSRTQSRGFVAIERTGAGGFSEEEREILTLLAQMASTALGALELSRTIQRSEVRWRVLVETAPVGIIEVDAEGTIEWWNRSAARIFAWPEFSSSPDATSRELPESARDRFAEIWADASAGTLEGSRDLPDVEVNGRQRHFTVSAAPLPAVGTASRRLLTLVDDVTNQRELTQELRHAHQMELRGQVASSIAHDFNNLLTLITGYAEILSKDLSSEQREVAMVQNIQSTASRASQLTAQLQAIGRTQSNESQVLSPVALIQSNAEVLGRIVGSDIELNLLLDDRVGHVRVDADQFEQMILNLSLNARDAMPEGGQLTIGVLEVGLDDVTASRHNLPVGRYVNITVSDTGEGMDEETQRRCFDPLFTTKGPFKGTGMGLAAARRFVEESGGAIEVTSTLREGTTFQIYLPAALEPLTTSTNEVQTERPRGTAAVLLAEDDEGLRKLMVQALRRNGYEVTEVDSGEAALQAARDSGTSFDVLVSDVVMGALSGCELAVLLQSSQPSLRVLLLSGTADPTVLDDLVEGTGRFLAKPFKPSALIDEVHALLDSSS